MGPSKGGEPKSKSSPLAGTVIFLLGYAALFHKSFK
jgi:hypothetical protein